MAIAGASQFTRGRPLVSLVGEVEHAEFADALALLSATCELLPAANLDAAELVVLVQSRPGVLSVREVERLRRVAPLAGVISLLGSWCEGETRTGRPPVGVRRVYWYDFPGWWRRQLALWGEGRCPEWARPDDAIATPNVFRSSGLIALESTCWETASALTDVLRAVGYTTTLSPASGVTAGIWEGRQLDESEAVRLQEFCRELQSCGAPVVALLDFPRRDRCERARELGAAEVFGKPWVNGELLATLERVVHGRSELKLPARAA